jgi:hypothetical protein
MPYRSRNWRTAVHIIGRSRWFRVSFSRLNGSRYTNRLRGDVYEPRMGAGRHIRTSLCCVRLTVA